MNVREIIEIVFLAIGIIIQIGCALGVMVMPNTYARLHYLSPASTVGAISIVIAVVVADPLGSASVKSILTFAVLFVTGPVLSHATARVVRKRQAVGVDGGGAET